MSRLAPGEMAGRFEILEFLGEGGMGAVYKARDTASGAVIALKLLKTAGLTEEETRRRLGVESRATLLLNHPNVVRTLEVGGSLELPFIASEFVDGVTLDRRIANGDLTLREILGIGAGIAEGLAASHAAGLVHCDLKPSNIILDREGTPRILDFGISRHRATAGAVSMVTTTIALSDTSGQLVGTCHYLSPEQVAGRAVDWRADLFSLGVLLYEMIAGRRPFQGQNPLSVAAAILTEPPTRPQTIDAAVWRVLTRCLEKEPARRWQSAADLARVLRDLDTGIRPARTRGYAAAAIAAAVLLAGLAGYALRAVLHPERKARIVQITHGDGAITGARFAADGTVLFSAAWNGGASEIHRIKLGDPTPQPTGEFGEIVALQGSRVLVRDNGSAALTRGLLNEGRIPLGADVVSADLLPPDEPYTARVRATGGQYVLEFPEGTPVYSTPTPLSGVRISPDAAWVAFFEFRPGTDSHQLVFVSRRGERKTLPRMWQFTRGIAWRRNGKEVVFGAANHVSDPMLRSATMTGEVRELLPVGADATVEDVDSNGRILARLSQNHAPVLLRRIATGETVNVNFFRVARRPSLSADASVAAFSEFLQSNSGATQSADPVYVWRADRRATNVAFANLPQVSPDGGALAALRPEAAYGFFLQVYSLRTGKLEFWKAPWEPLGLTWLPDSKTVCLSGRGERGVESVLVNADMTDRRLPPGVNPKWFAPDGRYAYGEEGGRLVKYDTRSWQRSPSCALAAHPYGPITSSSRALIGYRPSNPRPAGPARVEIITLDFDTCVESKVSEIQARSDDETVGEVRVTPDLRWAIYTAPRSTGNLFLIEGAL